MKINKEWHEKNRMPKNPKKFTDPPAPEKVRKKIKEMIYPGIKVWKLIELDTARNIIDVIFDSYVEIDPSAVPGIPISDDDSRATLFSKAFAFTIFKSETHTKANLLAACYLAYSFLCFHKKKTKMLTPASFFNAFKDLVGVNNSDYFKGKYGQLHFKRNFKSLWERGLAKLLEIKVPMSFENMCELIENEMLGLHQDKSS